MQITRKCIKTKNERKCLKLFIRFLRVFCAYVIWYFFFVACISLTFLFQTIWFTDFQITKFFISFYLKTSFLHHLICIFKTNIIFELLQMRKVIKMKSFSLAFNEFIIVSFIIKCFYFANLNEKKKSLQQTIWCVNSRFSIIINWMMDTFKKKKSKHHNKPKTEKEIKTRWPTCLTGVSE